MLRMSSLVLCVFLLACPGKADAQNTSAQCHSDWKMSLASLQSARKEIESPENGVGRVRCGVTILKILEDHEMDDRCGGQCRSEYGGLLADHAKNNRELANATASQNNKMAYYRREIETRRRLKKFLEEAEDPALTARYWSRNFEQLGEAMQQINEGRSYHDEALQASHHQVLSDEAFKRWVLAVRSCSAWDFRSDPNRVRTELCADDCKRALETIWGRVKQGRVRDRTVMVDVLRNSLPALDELTCAVEERS